MSACCENTSCDIEGLAKKQARVLWIVLFLNSLMFFIELYSGIISSSLSLIGDSLDMLGDAMAYGTSLYVLRRGIAAKARSAVFKARIIQFSALFILLTAFYRTIYRETPIFETMAGIGGLALVVNVFCLFLLTRHKSDDINMHSIWICSRNDIIANTSVVVASAFVWLLSSPWPDLLVGIGLTILFLRSASQIIVGSKKT